MFLRAARTGLPSHLRSQTWGSGLAHGFAQTFAPGSRAIARPESKLRCVETLVMDNGHWGFSDDRVTAHLPRWVVLFPQLRVLVLKGGRYSHKILAEDENSTPGNTFVAALKEACPDLYIEYSIGNSHI